MKKFRTEKRIKKIESVIRKRQFDLTVVLENIHDPHNVSAIYRTCDAIGIASVNLLYTIESFPKLSKTSSSSAVKWIETLKHSNAEECFRTLRNKGFKIYATLLDDKAKNIYDVDWTEKCAIVLGNEHRGVSEEAAKFSDELVYIPMHGMIQSLNVSVATAVILYEAQRQRALKGHYNNSSLTDKEIKKLIIEWAEK